MRRMTSAEKQKKHRYALTSAISWFLFGILAFLIPRAYTPVPYDALHETTATVSAVRSVFDIHGLSLQIVSSDGEKYTLAGTYERAAVKAALLAGDEVTIHYYQDLFSRVFRTRYAAEVTEGGETVVSFGGGMFVRFPWLRLFGTILILCGVSTIAYWRWESGHREKLEQMRDRRIEKRYGPAKNVGPKKMGRKRQK